MLFRKYILFRESESLFTILKRILRILTPFPEHNNKQNNPLLLFMMKVTWSQSRMFASLSSSLQNCISPSLIPAPSQFPQQASYFTVPEERLRGNALGLALFISRPLYIRFCFSFLLFLRLSKNLLYTAMKSLNLSDIKVITPKFASDTYNCTWVEIKPS